MNEATPVPLAAPATATPSAPQPPLPVTLAEYRGTAALLAAFVATMRLAVAFAAPFKDGGAAGVRGPERRRQLGKAVQNAPTNV